MSEPKTNMLAFENRIYDKPRPCPCCGGKELRLENLVIEGVVQCRNCHLCMIRKHSDKDHDDGLQLAIFAWNFRFDFDRG